MKEWGICLVKNSRLLVFTLVALIILGLIWYFAYPLKIQMLMRHTDKIEKIDFFVHSHGEVDHYSIQFDERTKINEMISVLDSVSYSRELIRYKGSTDKIIMMFMIYRNRDGTGNNYSFDINESGVIISNNKQYQMNGDTRKVFNNLYEWINNEGVFIPPQV